MSLSSYYVQYFVWLDMEYWGGLVSSKWLIWTILSSLGVRSNWSKRMCTLCNFSCSIDYLFLKSGGLGYPLSWQLSASLFKSFLGIPIWSSWLAQSGTKRVGRTLVFIYLCIGLLPTSRRFSYSSVRHLRPRSLWMFMW